MKKRLLIAALAMLSVATSFAYEIGEYAYTATQRVKVLSENLVQNGNFSAGLEGWTNAAGEGISADVWSMEEGAGPNGENVIMSINGSTDEAALCRAWTLEPGTYVVMYDIKGESYGTTGTICGNASCATFFLTSGESLNMTYHTEKDANNKDVNVWDEGFTMVAGVDGYKDEWKTNSYVFTADDGQKLVMHFEKLASQVKFTNVRIYRAQVVYDDRILQSKLAYVDRLVATGKFLLDTDNGFIENVVGTMRGMLGTAELDDPSNVEALMEAYETELLAWLDANAGDILKDEKKWSAYGDTRKAFAEKDFGNWDGTGDRWFHKNNGGSNEITNDGDEIGHRFQGGVEGNASLYYKITPANPGTYMFSADIVGHYMTGGKNNVVTYWLGTADNYVSDWNRDFRGVTMYAGKDIMGTDAEANAAMNNEQEGQKIDCGLINNPNAKNNPQKFVVFYEVSQEMVDAQTPITFGISYILDPDRTPTKMGSNVNIANPQIRLIGVTQAIIDYQNEVAKIIAQQGPLKERLDLAKEDLQKTAQDGYPWGKAALQEAIDAYQPVYEASLEVIDADGNVKNREYILQCMDDAVTGAGILYSDSLLNSVKAMNSARNAFSNINKPIATYRQKIADAEAVRDDGKNVMGDKKTFQAAIDAAAAKLDEVLAATTDETREADEATLAEALTVLAAAVEAFEQSAVIEPFIDIDFSNNFEEIMEDGVGTGNYMIKGAKGQMEFSTGSVNVEDNTGAPDEKGRGASMSFALGYGEELLDVLRVGNGTATVNIPEGVEIGDNDVVRFEFDVWFVQLSAGTINIDLLNAEDQRLAGFGYCAYGNPPADLNYNSFNNEANEGLDLAGYATNNKAGDVASHVDGNKNSFSLLIDYKAKAVQGIMVSSKGTCTGKPMPLQTYIDDETSIEDTKVAKFVLRSNYGSNNAGNYVGRRSWFDNLKAIKYASQAEGEVENGVKNIETKVADGAIYTISGQRLNAAPAKGLYIQNGKKFVIK